MININHIETGNYVNGYGKRFVLWVQGCSLSCSECWNKDTWDFSPNMLYSVQDIFEQISSQPGLDGVTFSGGEPFHQAEDLAELATLIRQKLKISVHVFTGFELEELNASAQKNLLDCVDLLVYGRFNSKKANNNQKLWVRPGLDWSWTFNNSDIEVDILESGDVQVTGYPNDLILKTLTRSRNEGI